MNRHLAIFVFLLSWAPLSPLLCCAQHDQRTAAAAKTIPDTSADFDDVKPGDFGKDPYRYTGSQTMS